VTAYRGSLLVTTATTVTTATVTCITTAVLTATIMTGIAHMALPIPRLIRMEVVERRFPVIWQRPMISIARIVAVIHVTVEAVRPMKPRSGAKEDAANKPIRPIVPIGRAVIRGIVKIAVRTIRSNTDINGNLGWRFRAADE